MYNCILVFVSHKIIFQKAMASLPKKKETRKETPAKHFYVEKQKKIVTRQGQVVLEEVPKKPDASMIHLIVKKVLQRKMSFYMLIITRHAKDKDKKNNGVKLMVSSLSSRFKRFQSTSLRKISETRCKKKTKTCLALLMEMLFNYQQINNKRFIFRKLKENFTLLRLKSENNVSKSQKIADQTTHQGTEYRNYPSRKSFSKIAQYPIVQRQQSERKATFLKERTEKKEKVPNQEKLSVSQIRNNQQFEKLLKLTPQAREALLKVQRFDRFIYAKEAEKACKQVVTSQLKRIQKLKNQNKTMRNRLFDNQITITALYNMLRLLNEMNRQYGIIKAEKHDEEEEKSEISKSRVISREKRKRQLITNDIQRILRQIQKCIQTEKDEKRLEYLLKQLIIKYENQEPIKSQIHIYRALMQSIAGQELKFQHEEALIESISELSLSDSEQGLQKMKKNRENLKRQKKIIPSDAEGLLKKLENLDKLYDLIIGWYERQWTWKKKTRQKLLMKENNEKKAEKNKEYINKLQNDLRNLEKENNGLKQSNRDLQLVLKNHDALEIKVKQIKDKLMQDKDIRREEYELKNNNPLKTMSLSLNIGEIIQKIKKQSTEKIKKIQKELYQKIEGSTKRNEKADKKRQKEYQQLEGKYEKLKQQLEKEKKKQLQKIKNEENNKWQKKMNELQKRLKKKQEEIEQQRRKREKQREMKQREMEKKNGVERISRIQMEKKKNKEIEDLREQIREVERRQRERKERDKEIKRNEQAEKKSGEIEKKLADEQYESQIAQMDKLRKELEEKLKEKDAEIERLKSENSAEWEQTFKELQKKYEALLKRFKDAEAEKDAQIGQLKTNIRQLEAKSKDKAKKGPADEEIEARKKQLEKKYQDLEKKLADEQYESQIAQMDKLRKELEEKLKEKDAEIERLKSENSAEWEQTFKELQKKYEALLKRFKDAEAEKDAQIGQLKTNIRQLEAKSKDKAKKGPADEEIEARKKQLEKKYQDLEKKLADEQYESQIAQMDKLRKELEEKLKEKDAEIERLKSENSAEWEQTFKELQKKYEALLKRFKDAEAEKDAQIGQLKTNIRQLEAKSKDKAKKGPADEEIEARKKQLEKKYQDLEKKLADEQYESQIAQMDKLRKELEEKLKEKDAEIERLKSENSAEWEQTFKELQKKYEALLKRFKDAEAEKDAQIGQLKTNIRQLEAKSKDKAKKGPADEEIEARKKQLEKKYQDLEKKLADEQYESQIAQMDKLRKELEEKLKEKDAEIERLKSENSAEWEQTFKELQKKYEALLKRFKDAEAEKDAQIGQLKTNIRQLEAKSKDKAKKGPADEEIEARKKQLEKKYQDLEKKLADEQYESQIAQMDKLRKELEEKLKEKDAEIERLKSENSAEWEQTFKELQKKYEALLKRFKDAEAEKDAQIGQLKTNIRQLEAKSKDKAKKGPADEEIEARKKQLEKKYQDLEKKLADEQYESQIAQMDKLRKELEEKLKEKDAEIERLKSENSAEWEQTFKELQKKYEALLKRFKDAEAEKDAQIGQLKTNIRQLEAKSKDKAKKGPADEEIEARKKQLEKKYQDLEKKLADEQYESQIAQMDKLRKELEEKLKEKDAEIERLKSENSAEWEQTFKELQKKYEALLKRFKDAEAEKDAQIGQLKTNIRQLEAKSKDKAKKGPADEEIEARKKQLEKKYQDLEKKLADEQYESQIAQMDKRRKELEEKLKEKDAEIERLKSENSAEWEQTFKELQKKYEALLKRFKDAEAEKDAQIGQLKTNIRQLEAKSKDKAKKGPADEEIEARKKQLEKKYQDLEKKLADEQYESQIAQMDKLRKELEEKLKEKDAEIERLKSENSAEWEQTFKELQKKYEALLKRFKDAEAEKDAQIGQLKTNIRQLEAKSKDKAKKGPADEEIEARKKQLEKKYQDLEKKLADEQYESQIAQMDKLRKELEEKLKEKDAEIERLKSENSAEWEQTFKELQKKYEALLKRFKDAEAEKDAQIGQLKTNIRQLEAKSKDKAKKGPADEEIEARKKQLEKKYQDLEKKLADEQYESQIAQMDKLRKELEEKLKEKDAEIERLKSENSAEWEQTFKELQKKYEALLKRFKDAEAEKDAQIGQLKTNIRQLEAKSKDKAKKGPADEEIEARKKQLEKKYQDLEKKLADEQYESQIAQMDKLRKELEEKLKEKDAEIERLKSENSAEWEQTFKELQKKYEALLKRFKDAEAEKDAQIGQLKTNIRQLEAKSKDKAKKGPADEEIEARKKQLEKKYQDLEKKLADEQYESQIAQMDKLRKELEEKLKEKDAEIERLKSENSAEWEQTFKELQKKYEALLKRFKDAEAEKDAQIGQLKTNIRQLEAKSKDKAKKGPADEEIEARKKQLEKKYQDLEKKLADEQYESQIAQMDKLRKELEEKLKEKDAEIERLKSENSAEWEQTFKELQKKYEALLKRFKDAEAEKDAQIGQLKTNIRQLEAKSKDKAKKGPADEEIEARKKQLEKKYQDLEKKLADEQYESQIAQMDKLRKELEEKLKEKDAEIERLKSENSAEWEQTFKELQKKYEALLKRFKDAEAEKDAQIGQLKTNIRQLEAKSKDKAKKGPADEEIEARKKQLEKKYQDLEKKLADEQYESQIAQMDKLRKELEEKLKEKDAEIERLKSENSAEWEQTFKELQKKYEALLKRFKDAEAEKDAQIGQLKTNIRQLEAKSKDKAKKGPADEEIEARKKQLEKKYQDLEKKLADEQYESQIAQMDKLRKELEEKLKEKDAEIERLKSENSAEWEQTFKELQKKYEALLKRFKDAEAEKDAQIGQLKTNIRQLEAKSKDKAKKGPADEEIEARKKQLEKKYQDLEKKLADEQYESQIAQMDKLRKELEEKLKEKDAEIERLKSENSAEWEQTFKELQKKYEALLKRFKDTQVDKDNELLQLKSQLQSIKLSTPILTPQYITSYSKLQQQFSQVTQILETKQLKISTLHQRIHDLQSQLSSLQDLYSSSPSHQELFSSLQFKYNNLLDSLAEKDIEITNLNSIISTLQSKYTDLLSRQQPSLPHGPRDHIFIPVLQTELSHYRNLQSQNQHLNNSLNAAQVKLKNFKSHAVDHIQSDSYAVQTNITFKPSDSALSLESLPSSAEQRDLFFSDLLDQAVYVSNVRRKPRVQHHKQTETEQYYAKLPVQGIQNILPKKNASLSEDEFTTKQAQKVESEDSLKNQLNQAEENLRKKDQQIISEIQNQQNQLRKIAVLAEQNNKLKLRMKELDIDHDKELNRLKNEICKLQKSLKQNETKVKSQRQAEDHRQRKERNPKQTFQSLKSDNIRLHSEIDKVIQQNREYRDKNTALDLENEKYRQQLIVISQRMSQSTIYNSQARQRQKKIIQGNPEMLESDGQDQSQQCEYDAAQLEILKRINLEVADLVQMNRRLQLKLVLLQSQAEKMGDTETVNYFLMLQARMEKLVTFLMTKDYIKNGDLFANFSEKANLHLLTSSHEQYMDSWLDFMKSLFEEFRSIKDNQFRVKASELNDIRNKMTKMLENKIQKGSQSAEQLRQYKMIQVDVRFLLREYMSTMDPEYLEMMCKSLGVQRL